VTAFAFFDRWGNTVFRTTSFPIVWDGTFNGKMMEPGMYVHVAKLELASGERKVLFGDLTVIK
jgi:hypothetical protein